MVSESNLKQFPEWQALQKKTNECNRKLPGEIGKFIVTDSRRNYLRMIESQFRMRDVGISNPQLASFTVPGLLIEGPPAKRQSAFF